MSVQHHRSRLIFTSIVALGSLGFVVLVLGSNDLQSVPGMPWSLLVAIGIGSANLLLAWHNVRQARHLPLLLRAFDILTAILVLIAIISTNAETIVRANGQKPAFTFPSWLFFSMIILSLTSALLRSAWEQPNKHAWVRITRATLISVGIVVGFILICVFLLA